MIFICITFFYLYWIKILYCYNYNQSSSPVIFIQADAFDKKRKSSIFQCLRIDLLAIIQSYIDLFLHLSIFYFRKYTAKLALSCYH